MKNFAKKFLSLTLGVCFLFGLCGMFCSCNFIGEYETRYETEVEFYVNPKKADENDSESQYGVYGAYGKHVMDNMVKLLDSDIFTLRLLQEQGIAPKATLEDGTENPAFQEWAKSEDYTTYFVGAKEGIEYSYATGQNAEDDLSRSFIYVKISVTERELAELFLESVKSSVPAFVEENMTVPSGYEGTNCRRVSRLEEIKEVKTKKNKTLIF